MNQPNAALNKPPACGQPIDFAFSLDEPVIFSASGNALHDRVQVTVSVRQLWYILESLHFLRLNGVSGGVDDLDPRAYIGELYDQMAAFWVAFRNDVPSHAGAHARALRLSNRDGFHSDQAGVDA